jgi:putative transposase
MSSGKPSPIPTRGMARPLYFEVPEGIYHVTSRGIARRTVFDDDYDCRTFLICLRHTVLRYEWRCLAYCLMQNHFHLLVQTPKANLANGMRDLKSGYVTAYNARRGEDGSRFKARYWRQLVQDDAYLLTAAIYVALNPVRAGKVAHPAAWPWSSFGPTVRGERGFTDAGPILRLLHPDPAEARIRFSELAEDSAGLPVFDPSLPIVGDKAFVERHAPTSPPDRHVVKAAWKQARPALDDLRRDLPEGDFLREARFTYRYTLKEIAAQLGCHECTVSRRLRLLDAGTRPL